MTGSKIVSRKQIKAREPDRVLRIEVILQIKESKNSESPRPENLKARRVRSRNNKLSLCAESSL